MKRRYTKDQLVDTAKRLRICNKGTKSDLCHKIMNKMQKQINVLILCQRKPSINLNALGKRDAEISTKIVQELVALFFNTKDVNIEYLVNKQPATHQVELGSSNHKTIEFTNNNKNKYDLILFYTCPIPLMMSKQHGNPLLYDHLKMITKPTTKYVIGHANGLLTMAEAYKLLQNMKNERFNRFRRIYHSIPVYQLT